MVGCGLSLGSDRTTDLQQPTTHLRRLFLAHLPAMVIVPSVSKILCHSTGFGRTPGSANKIKRTQNQRARLRLNPLSHEPPRSREVALPPPTLAQSGGLVSVGTRGLRQSAPGKQTNPPEHWLLDLPLVPCDGARVVRR